MIVAIVSAVLSLIPAILVGKNVAVGWGILCYFLSLIAGVAGFYIGKFLNEFVGDRFIITNGGFMSLVTEKFNALYGPQITGFLIGVFVPMFLLVNGVEKNKSVETKTKKEIKSEVSQTVDSIGTFDFMIPVKGGEFLFYENGKGLSPEYEKYSNLKLKVDNFAISKVPVSSAMYAKITGTEGKYTKKALEENFPFENQRITWYEALVFCNQLSKKNKLTPCYSINGSRNPEDWGDVSRTYKSENFTWDSVKCDFSANGFRLPTVAEWVYAFCASEQYNVDLSGIPYKYPNVLGLTKPCDTRTGDWIAESELLWNWSTSDFNIFEKDNAAPTMGNGRLCVKANFSEYRKYKSNRKTSFANYSFSEINDYTTSLRLVRTLSERELDNALKNQNPFDLKNFGISMVLVEGGDFKYGGTEQNEIPEHNTIINDFYMSSTVIPCSLYPNVRLTYQDFRDKKNDMSVKSFELVEALQFCNYLSIMSKLEPCYDFSNYKEEETHVTFKENANGYRLPTEEEWEYAAKGGKNKDSYRWSGSDNIEEVAWYDANKAENQEKIVGLKKSNSLGLYDMSGLENEFVWSNSKSGAALNDLFENYNNGYIYFVTRGGNWSDSYKNISLTQRRIRYQDSAAFRLVRNK